MVDETKPEPSDENADAGQDSEELPPLRLDHFLQMCGVLTGGQAKQLIQNGLVLLNGEVETRRRKKLLPGDLISIDGQEFEVSLEEEDSEDAEVDQPDPEGPLDDSVEGSVQDPSEDPIEEQG